MLAGGVALTPAYASYNKQQLAITKLAIKSVARLTKIAHWAERQFDFEVFFLFFARFLFVSCLFCCLCCLLVVSGLRLCIRDVVVAHCPACGLCPVITKLFKWNVCAGHYIIGLDYCIFLRCFVCSLSLSAFSVLFLCWLRPEMRKFCTPKTEKIYENYCGNELTSLFPFIHFRSSMAIVKNVFQSIPLEAAALQPKPEPEPHPEPSHVIIILALRYAHPLAMVAFLPHWICISFVVFCLSNNNCRFINANVTLCRIECDFNSQNFYSTSMKLLNKNKYRKLSHWSACLPKNFTVVKVFELSYNKNDAVLNCEILFHYNKMIPLQIISFLIVRFVQFIGKK